MDSQPGNVASSKKIAPTQIAIAFVVLLGLLLLFGLLFSRKQDQSPRLSTQTPTAPVLPKEANVDLASTGFTPKTVTIAVGSAVRWANKTNEKTTVNSDDHPTHQKFKELNLGEFGQNSTLVHIFTKPGTYTYHDHFHPTRTGTVIVQ